MNAGFKQFACLLACIWVLSAVACQKSVPLSLQPGVQQISGALNAQIQQKYRALGKNYTPRTKHVDEKGRALFTNRLFLENSPYLNQHAHNPVNWYPWGEEAFKKALKEKKPIFLSVGYATCHWCHVMEEESFEDLEIAEFLNRNYVAIKVDREERPDIDAVYMKAVNALTGRGGWPMSTWLTPDKEVFFGGTYFPARDGDRGRTKGFLTLLQEQKERFDVKPDEVAAEAKNLSLRLKQMLSMSTKTQGNIQTEVISRVLNSLGQSYLNRFDAEWGGLKTRGNKFPSSFPTKLLLNLSTRKDMPALQAKLMQEAAHTTLEKMALGGLYDQVGGGFHRYSTDPYWFVPHFEKMLYDNALLLSAYAEAKRQKNFGKESDSNNQRSELYDDRIAATIEFLARKLRSPSGAFYAASDADSLTATGEREEGEYFIWSDKEMSEALGKVSARNLQRTLADKLFGLHSKATLEGKRVLFQAETFATIRRDLLNVEGLDFNKTLISVREKLYQAREKRAKPLVDTKIISAWNGLAIQGLARVARNPFSTDFYGHLSKEELEKFSLHKREKTVDMAEKVAAFFIQQRGKDEGKLHRIYTENIKEKSVAGSQEALLDDHAFLAAGMLELFSVTGKPRYLKEAVALSEVIQRNFYEDGTLFYTPKNHEELLVREVQNYDGAVPSGTSFHVMNLARLASLTGKEAYRKEASNIVQFLWRNLEKRPSAMTELMTAVDYLSRSQKQVVCVESNKLWKDRFKVHCNLPYRLLSTQDFEIIRVTPKNRKSLEKLLPIKGKKAMDDKNTAYVCENYVCQRPTTNSEEFKAQLLSEPG